MPHRTDLLADQQRAALTAGITAVETITRMIRQLEYLKTVQLAGLDRLASHIARDEGHADHGELVHRAVEAEVAAATRIGHVAAANRMGHATRLLEQYPLVSAAFAEGALSLRHTEILVDAGQILQSPAARADYEAAALPQALESTPYGLRAHARRLAEHFAERGIDERHREAEQRRGITITDADDGMADLTARIGAAEAYAIKDRLARIAHHLNTAAHTAATATAAAAQQTQADVFVDLLLTGSTAAGLASHVRTGSGTGSGADTRSRSDTRPESGADTSAPSAPSPATDDPISSIQGRVQVTVPVFTLMDKDPEADAAPYAFPAELEGYGPIDADTARRLAAGTTGWERVLTHPMHGTVLTVDRYRPTAELRRLLGARDQHCRFPGCTRRLDHCDIDHTQAAAHGGKTEPGNLAHLCRRDHTLKHFTFLGGTGWKPRQRDGGALEWTSPTGRRYTTKPSSSVRFAPVHKHSRTATSPGGTALSPDSTAPSPGSTARPQRRSASPPGRPAHSTSPPQGRAAPSAPP